jgi:hypothetical protein
MKDCEADAAILHGGVVIFAEGTTCCAACAPRVLNRDQVERAALQQAPRYSGNEGCIWTVFAGNFPDQQPNPRPCPDDMGRQYWLLVCSP